MRVRDHSRIICIFTLLLVFGMGGCSPPSIPGQTTLPPAYAVGDSIDLAREASLATTQAIEIGVLQINGKLSYPIAARIEDADAIEAIVARLDTQLELTLPVVCVDQFRLRFLLSDGSVVEFGYACEPDGTFLHGGIPPLMGLAVQPPDEFRALITAAVQ